MDVQRMTDAVANIVNDESTGTAGKRKRCWEKVIADFRALNTERVRIVHGHWYEDLATGIGMQKPRRGDKFTILRHYESSGELKLAIDKANRLKEFIVMSY